MACHELRKSEYHRVHPLLQEMEFNLILTAVLEGTTLGRVYVDDPAQPESAFVCSVEGYYALGRPDSRSFNQALGDLILGRIFQGETLRPDDEDFYLYYYPQGWEDQLDLLLPGKQPLKEVRRYYLCRATRIDWRTRLPAGFVMASVDDIFLARTDLANHGDVRYWVTTNWNSIAAYLDSGFGFCLVHDQTIVSMSVADCVSGSRCEIGIRTDWAYRRRGFGTLTAAAAVEHALAAGIAEIGWHCTDDNLGSIGVAENVGFELRRKYPVYLCFFDDGKQLAFNGLYARRAGRGPEALTWYGKAIDHGYMEAWVYYEAACLQSLQGAPERAIASLHQAIDHGWTDGQHLQSDPDLDRLHSLPAWQAILQRFE